MTKNAAIFCIFFICPTFIVTGAYAECRSCSESYGVDIRLKTGEKMSGYIAWYPEIAPISVLVEKLNLFANENRPLPSEIGIHKSLTFYTAFNRVAYPVKTYLPKKEDVLEIPFERVAQLKENPKYSLRINTTGMRPVPSEDIVKLEITPIYVISTVLNGAWREYSLAISSSARPIDIINHEGKYIKSIVFFGELLGRHDFQTSTFDCVSSKPENLRVCADAKREWKQLELESGEIKNICGKKDEVYERFRKSADPSGVWKSDEYKKAEMDCFQVEEKFLKKYQSQFKYWGNAGFVQIAMSNEYTLLP